MTRSRIRNLDQGYRLCELCGRLYHWSTFCTCAVSAEVDEIKAQAMIAKAKRNIAAVADAVTVRDADVDIHDGDTLRPGWIDKRARMVERANTDDVYFHGLCDADDSAQGMMGDRD